MILISTIGALMKEGTLLKTKEIDTFYKGQAVVIAKIEEVLDGAMIVSFATVATSNKRGLNEKGSENQAILSLTNSKSLKNLLSAACLAKSRP